VLGNDEAQARMGWALRSLDQNSVAGMLEAAGSEACRPGDGAGVR
jgi:hypothetical protein